MNLEPSEEQKAIIAQVRRFVRDEIVPLEDKLDPDASELPPEDRERLVAKVKAMGLYGLDIPAEFGGPGIDMTTRVLLAIEMGQHRAGIYVPCYGVFGAAGLAQLYEATAEQKEKYLHPMLRGEKKAFFGLTEPSGGSDPARAIRTRAVKTNEGWTINGSKVFISGADKADFGLVFARTDPEKGRGGVTCFIVETSNPGFHVHRVVHTLRSSHYATELGFEDMKVPDTAILGELNQGFAIANERLSRQRIPYAAQCLAPAYKAHELALDYAKQRETFGAKLASRQAIQWMLVDNEIDLRQSTLMCLAAAAKCDAGEPFRMEAGLAKLVASEAAGRVVDRSMQIFGGYGMTKDFPFERWYRELRIRRVGEGPNEVQRHVVARDLLGDSLR
jgi:alkylation response protein AidB-like acyl-CoA dehydrogenase